MASPVPAKSQPLYSFSLPQWKLTKNHTNNHHRGRRGLDSSTSSSSQQLPPLDTATRRSPARRHLMRESAYESESSQAVLGKRKNSLPTPLAHSGKNGYIVSSSSLDHAIVKADKQAEVSDQDKESRSKIYIRLKTQSKNNKQCEGQGQEEGNPDIEGEVEESMGGKTWNLRPRKPIRKQTNMNGGGGNPNPNPSSVGKSSPENKVQPPQTVHKRSEMRSGEGGLQKEKKQKFSISLSRDEIEEDIYAMIGSKPNRRPKKRSKIVQRQLDNVFPGLWLSSITPDVYKVSEIPMKG
ncbi:uncharacterized protein LOC124945903 [Impatiens glandulifera]|uniref:uncharacterized protein LOC124945903 n=1 Tax=Impatiens glandulifera TaxID=253017 RepID=UPI001FB12BD0|nr:uncharacterized protein LOC124945903 [Impatiens glandulifera]